MRNGRRARRAAVALVAAGAAALGVTSLASGAGSSAPDRVVAKAVVKNNRMAFVLSDDSVQSGGKLVIKNKTNAPHTLSLVTKRLVPRTNKQIAKCRAKGHICAEIAKWHGAKGNSPPTINPVDVGKPGWDRPGNLKRKGDSVFFTPQQPAATRVVSAKAGKTLHFICAIHPEMHGTLHVK